MRIPVPQNRLVALTLLGIALTALLSVALASPSLLPAPDDDDGDGEDRALGPDAPEPNADFTPAVRDRGDDRDEYEEHEYEGYEDDEYEEDDDD